DAGHDQLLPGLPVLYPLGHDVQPEVVAQLGCGTDDGGVIGIGRHVGHKTTVDLQLAHGEAFEVRQRRIASAEVVDRELYSEIGQALKDGDGLGRIHHQGPLCYLESEVFGPDVRV